MGCSLERSNSFWVLEEPSPSVSHKHVRTQSCKECTKEIEPYPESDNINPERQYDHGFIYQQTGRNSFTYNKSISREDLNNMSTQASEINSGTHTRSSKCTGRLNFLYEDRPTRLDDNQEEIRSNPATVRVTEPGRICQSHESLNTSVHIMEDGFRDDSYQCSTRDKGKVNDSNIISSMAVSPLVLSSVITPGRPTLKITEQLSNTNQEPQSVLSDKQMGFLHSSYIRSHLMNQGFSEKTIKLYKAAFDTNFTKTVLLNIKKWLSWCTERQVDPVAGSLNSIVEFLNDQLDSGKAYNTIAGYRSAISEIYDWVNYSLIGSHPIIVKAMRGVYHKNPPPPPDDEVIDLVPAFNKKPKRTQNIYSHSGNKPATKRIYVGSYPDLPEISPLAAVDALLIRTHAWHCKNEQKANLLLTSTGLYNPPSPDTVARWIKDILVEASLNLKAKDARSLTAFYAQNLGIDLSTILAMGNWSSHGIYQQFYRKGS
ncbi:32055_t:CDS:2 [Gigaspora margarita]|uniref:32055_t:CDS:1 n=1 Tax=Gigaspora margarita TaxID=4874 RepID=A0ABN7WC20_GIGMA|nr:32055_t:CDS:2 [Gigaspora margarita]